MFTSQLSLTNDQSNERNKKVNESTKRAIDYYADELKNAIDNGFTIAESHEIAKSAMSNKFVEVKDWKQTEWGTIGRKLQLVVSQYNNTEKVDVTEPVKFQTTGKMNYFQVYRNFCEAGFLPKYLEPLIGLKKQQQITSYKCQLADEGYVFEETPYGWIVIDKQDPKKIEIQREREELLKRLKELDDELNGSN